MLFFHTHQYLHILRVLSHRSQSISVSPTPIFTESCMLKTRNYKKLMREIRQGSAQSVASFHHIFFLALLMSAIHWLLINHLGCGKICLILVAIHQHATSRTLSSVDFESFVNHEDICQPWRYLISEISFILKMIWKNSLPNKLH